MIQAIHKGVEIELESHQGTHGQWMCDYTLILHPDGIRTRMTHPAKAEFATKDVADENAPREARAEIDRVTKGKPEETITDPPRQVRV